MLDAARELTIAHGFSGLRLEHVAARAGVGKATIYRRWPSKQALALDLLLELAMPHIAVDDVGDTAAEVLACVTNAIGALTTTPFGPVIRALLSEIAVDPSLGDPFRETVVRARRLEVAAVVRRGIERGDLAPAADSELAADLLIGPVYFRLVFGGALDEAFAGEVASVFARAYAPPELG